MTDLTPEQRVAKLRENHCPHEYGAPSHLQRCQEECPDCIRNEIRAAEQAAREKALREAATLCRHGKTNRSGYAIERAILRLLEEKND